MVFGPDKTILIGDEAERILENEPVGCGLRNFKTLLAAKHDAAFQCPAAEKAFYDYVLNNGFTVNDVTPEVVTALYLAKVMAVARHYLEDKFKDRKLNISFNVCVPIDYMQNNVVLADFERVFAVAERLERTRHDGGNCDIIAEAHKLLGSVQYDKNDPATRVFAIPEAVAEVAGYLRSLRKKEGIHALIDFGAGTTDVSIFNLMNFAEEFTYWYASRNIPVGMFSAEKMVSEYLQKTQGFCSVRQLSELLNELKSRKKEHPDICFGMRNVFEFLRESTDYRQTWKDAYQHYSKESKWHDVKIFISGGGVSLPYIDDIFSVPSWWDHLSGYRYVVEIVPVPDDYANSDRAPFYRMLVAYGLCTPVPLLGKFVLPRDCPVQTPNKMPIRSYIDWEATI